MVRKNLTLQEIRREGFKALLDRLGPAGAIQFLQEFDPRRGDYTKERHQWLDDLTIDQLKHDIERKQSD